MTVADLESKTMTELYKIGGDWRFRVITNCIKKS
jgi:hypothetical protein